MLFAKLIAMVKLALVIILHSFFSLAQGCLCMAAVYGWSLSLIFSLLSYNVFTPLIFQIPLSCCLPFVSDPLTSKALFLASRFHTYTADTAKNIYAFYSNVLSTSLVFIFSCLLLFHCNRKFTIWQPYVLSMIIYCHVGFCQVKAVFFIHIFASI